MQKDLLKTRLSLERTHIQGNFETTRQVVNSLGRVVVVGQFLDSPAQLEAAVAVALESGDTEALQSLPGSYSTIVEREGETIVSSDVSGQHPLYWRSEQGQATLDTQTGQLGDELNLCYLAAAIGNVEVLAEGDSAFQGVHQINGGQQVRFTEGQPAVTNSGEIIPSSKLTLEEAAANLREALTEAIGLRMAMGKVATSDYSGGFDSTSIAHLAAARTEGVLEAFIQYHPAIPAGDLSYARKVVAGNPKIHLNELRGTTDTLPFQALDRVEYHDEPDPAAVINARIKARLLGARACGSQLHFTGDGGDAVLDATPNHIVDLARLGKRAQLEEASLCYARIRHEDPAELIAFADRHAERTLSDDLLLLAKKLQNPQLPTDNQTWITLPERALTFLTLKMRGKLSEKAERRAATSAVPAGVGMADYVAMAGLRSGGAVHRHLREIAAVVGIATHAPFMDTRVVRACLQLPAYVRADPGHFKKILRTAFRDILPQSLLSRTSKGAYTGEIYKGLRASRPVIDELLANSRLAEMEVIDPEAVKKEIERIDIGLPAEFSAIDKIVASEIWLRQREV